MAVGGWLAILEVARWQVWERGGSTILVRPFDTGPMFLAVVGPERSGRLKPALHLGLSAG